MKTNKTSKTTASSKAKRSNVKHCVMSPDKVITVVAKENPYRGNFAKLYQRLRTGMTVERFRANLEKSGITRPPYDFLHRSHRQGVIRCA